MSFSAASLISPKAGMSIVKAAITQTLKQMGLKQEVTDFDIIYKAKEKLIDIRIYNFRDKNNVIHPKKVFKYDEGDKLVKILSSQLEAKKFEGTIDYGVFNYKKLDMLIYITKSDGSKVTEQLDI